MGFKTRTSLPHDAVDQLFRAIEDKDTKRVAELVEAGIDLLEARDVFQRSPIQSAADAPSVPIIRLLLRHSVPVDHRADGSTALHVACHAKRGKAVEILLSAGADPNARNKNDWTPLMLAVLMSWGTGEPQVLSVVQQLLAAGVDVNAHGLHGQRALPEAVRMGYLQTARLLLTAGADPNLCDEHGYAAMHQCRVDTEDIDKSIALAELLLDAGANINAKTTEEWNDVPAGSTFMDMTLECTKKAEADIAPVLALLADRGARSGCSE